MMKFKAHRVGQGMPGAYDSAILARSVTYVLNLYLYRLDKTVDDY
jgi:hypothetical protein